MDRTVNRACQAGHRHDSDHLENTCGEPGMRNRCVILFDRASPSNWRDWAQPPFCYKLPRAVKTTLTKAAAGSTGARSTPPPLASFDQTPKVLLSCGLCNPQANIACSVVAVTYPPSRDTQEEDMAKETGPSQHRAEAANRTAEQMMKGAVNLMPWGIMHHATKHVAAALTFTQKLSQATDLDDRMRIHAEHAQTHIDLFNERAKELGDAMAVAGNFVGAIVSQLRLHAHLGEMARKSSAHKAADREGQTPISRSKRG